MRGNEQKMKENKETRIRARGIVEEIAKNEMSAEQENRVDDSKSFNEPL